MEGGTLADVLQGEGSRIVGYRSLGLAAFDCDGGADEGFAVDVAYHTFADAGLLHGIDIVVNGGRRCPCACSKAAGHHEHTD